MERFRKILNWVFILTLTFMLLAVVGMEENSTYRREVFNEDLSDGWMLSETDGTRSDITFPYDYQEGKPNIQLVRTLPQVPDYAVLQIMSNYKSLTAYVDGEEIFHALPSTVGLVNTDMGHYVALIPLSTEHSGKEIMLDITERESGYRTEIRSIRLTSSAQHGFQIFEENAPHLIFSVAMLLCAIAAFGTWLALWVNRGAIPETSYHPLLWIGLFAASVGTWFFTEAYVWAISTGLFAASGTLNYIALSLMPLSLLGVLTSVASEKLLALQQIMSLAKIVLIAEWVLFLTGLVDFSEMLMLLQLECIVAASICAVFLIWKRDLFLVGDVIRYGMVAVLTLLLITLVTYARGGEWFLWALATASVVFASIIVSTVIRIHWAVKDMDQSIRYKEYALTDIMTGLKSRYAYTIFEAQQKMGTPAATLYLIFLDIDMLKQTNDTLGHVAGDEMIVAASKCIKDAFGDMAECFRMGGDEFLVAMTAEENVVQKRLSLFNRLVSQWSGRYVDSLSISYGVAAANEHPGLDFEELLKAADYMMYQRKKQQADYR